MVRWSMSIFLIWPTTSAAEAVPASISVATIAPIRIRMLCLILGPACCGRIFGGLPEACRNYANVSKLKPRQSPYRLQSAAWSGCGARPRSIPFAEFSHDCQRGIEACGLRPKADTHVIRHVEAVARHDEHAVRGERLAEGSAVSSIAEPGKDKRAA